MRRRQEFLRVFTRGLACLAASRIPLDRGLRSLSEQQEDSRARQLLETLWVRVCSGSALSGAMAREPWIFSKFSVGLVLFGEETGKLPESLIRVADFLEKEYCVRLKMRNALRYPMFLLATIVFGTVLLIKIFIPAFVPIFQDLAMTLPLSTRFLIFISGLMSHWVFWLFLGMIMIFLGSAMRYLLPRKQWRFLWFDRLVLELPWVGQVQKKGLMTQMAWSLATCSMAGLSLTVGLRHLSVTTNNLVFRRFFHHAQLALLNGVPLSTFFLRQKHLVPPFLGHLMAIGEESGCVDVLMMKSASILEQEMDVWVQRLTLFMEPFILLFMGISVSFILVGVFSPIYGMLGRF